MSIEESLRLSGEGDIGVLEFDLVGEKVNKLSSQIMIRLRELIGEVKKSNYKLLIIKSNKPKIFIAGADIEEIKSMTKKEDFDLAVRSHFHVRGLEIAMDDAFLMRFFERVCDLLRDGDRFVHTDGASAEPLSKIVAGHEFHHEADGSVRFLEAINGGDVRMVEGGENLGLATESADAIGVLREGRGQHLDGDFASQFRITRAEDFAHAAGADGRGDLIGPEA